MIPPIAMGKRKRNAAGEKREVHPRVQELLGPILAKAPTREKLSKSAGRHVQTLYGYMNGRRRNPSLLVFDDLARSVGLTLVLSDGTSRVGACEERHLVTDLEKEIIGWLRALPSDGDRAMLRKQVLDFFLSRTSGTGIARPPEPAEQQE